MMEGYGYICVAHEALCGKSGDARQQLQEAAHAFWKALLHEHTWPEPMRKRAAAAIALLFARGTIEATIAAMADHEVRSAMEVLEQFTDQFLRGAGEEDAEGAPPVSL